MMINGTGDWKCKSIHRKATKAGPELSIPRLDLSFLRLSRSSLRWPADWIRTWSRLILHAWQEPLHAFRGVGPRPLKSRPPQVNHAASWQPIQDECRAYVVLACRI